MADDFESFSGGLSSPAVGAAAVTPNDSTGIDVTRSLYVGTAGNVAVEMKDGTEVTFTNVQDGSLLPLRVSKVKSTNTTATNIIALY